MMMPTLRLDELAGQLTVSDLGNLLTMVAATDALNDEHDLTMYEVVENYRRQCCGSTETA
jgi:hypothetical protein